MEVCAASHRVYYKYMTAPVPYGDPDGVDEVQLFSSGFHPTQAKPIPSMQCTGVVRSGDRAGQQCRKYALLGTTVCPSHGATLPAVKKAAERVVEEARAQLLFHAAEVPDMLFDLAKTSASDAVRLGAMNSLLDRAGMKQAEEVKVTVQHGQDPHEILADKLAKLRERVVEGEVVDDTVQGELGAPVTVEPEEDPTSPPEE